MIEKFRAVEPLTSYNVCVARTEKDRHVELRSIFLTVAEARALHAWLGRALP